MMNKPTDWMPLVRHKRSQNTGVVYTLVDEVMTVLDALMRISSRTEGEFGSPCRGPLRNAMWVMCSYVRVSRGSKGAHDDAFRQFDLEVVVLSRDGSGQRDLGCVAKRIVTRLAAGQEVLGLGRAPWLGRD